MTTLHDRLELELDATKDRAGARLDIDRLCRVARIQGTRALRRRRAGTAAGGLAAVAVIGLAIGSTHGNPARPGYADGVATGDATPTGTPTSTFDPTHPGATGPATAPGVAAALRWAVADEQAGSASDFRGQHGHEWYSQLQWTPADSSGLSVIGINVQTDNTYTGCPVGVFDCQERTLPNGSKLLTYEERQSVAGGTGITRIAALMRPEGLSVAVEATNGLDLPMAKWDVTRPEPPLSADQLATIAEQPFWGRTLPSYFISQGRDLPGYEDINSGFATPSNPDNPAGG